MTFFFFAVSTGRSFSFHSVHPLIALGGRARRKPENTTKNHFLRVRHRRHPLSTSRPTWRGLVASTVLTKQTSYRIVVLPSTVCLLDSNLPVCKHRRIRFLPRLKRSLASQSPPPWSSKPSSERSRRRRRSVADCMRPPDTNASIFLSTLGYSPNETRLPEGSSASKNAKNLVHSPVHSR
uniref:Secreted protein n=1 Tax=Steinernema glaseri TaxID=37863 RepID=A0A1I7ZAE9_9BILA